MLQADRIANFNRRGAERSGYFRSTRLAEEGRAATRDGLPLRFFFYDSNTGKPLFHVGGAHGRSWEAFWEESAAHGWPSFRDGEVEWAHVRVLDDGEVVSTAGTHLGHNLPDLEGNRFCINLVCVAGSPDELDRVLTEIE